MWLEAVNRRPFGRPEAAFYEAVAAPAVRAIVGPVLASELAAIAAGRVLDVGCGGGALTRELARPGRVVVGVDPSVPQMRRLRRGGGIGGAGGAGALPFPPGTFDAVVSSCAIKHWPDLTAGLAECARVLRPGGRLVVAEIDGGDNGDLRRFAARTRIPPGLRWLYPGFARRTFVPVSPSAETLVAAVAAFGFGDVDHRRIDGLPFLVLTADRDA